MLLDYYWIWFSSLRTLSAHKKKLLLERCIDPGNIFNLKMYDLKKIKYLTQDNMEQILDFNIRDQAKRLEEYIIKNEIGILKYFDEKYPCKLRNIFDPPAVLYSRGNIRNLKSVGIIGSRAASSYGASVALDLSYSVAKEGYAVISGLAKGIDSFAHKGALKALGHTTAVLGCAVDVCYPKENKYLMDLICENGLVISEYIPGSSPQKRHFPERNRIISGVSDCIVVVEARTGSGSLITVEFALEHGKEVFAVPGNIDSKNSEGTNLMIRDGARPVLNAADFLEDLRAII